MISHPSPQDWLAGQGRFSAKRLANPALMVDIILDGLTSELRVREDSSSPVDIVRSTG
ncbi:hypothetical protein KCP70_01690 [Salmonella enterica subsp. enterica]|nr:hypothetical protein KCP70_01690 [Salmonella enterica subsp. enterica]